MGASSGRWHVTAYEVWRAQNAISTAIPRRRSLLLEGSHQRTSARLLNPSRAPTPTAEFRTTGRTGTSSSRGLRAVSERDLTSSRCSRSGLRGRRLTLHLACVDRLPLLSQVQARQFDLKFASELTARGDGRRRARDPHRPLRGSLQRP